LRRRVGASRVIGPERTGKRRGRGQIDRHFDGQAVVVVLVSIGGRRPDAVLAWLRPLARRLRWPSAEDTTMTKMQVTISWQAIRNEDTLEVHDRARLLEHADGCIPVGTAPDGLPLVLRVSRSASIVGPVLRALNAHDLAHLSNEVRAQVTQLNRQVQTERRGLGIAPRGPAAEVPHYVTMTSVPKLMGDTLLSRLLGPTSPLLLPEDARSWQHDDHVAVKTSCGVLMDAAELQQLKRELDVRQHLCVPLDDSPTTVVRQGEGTAIDVTQGRPFVAEDLRGLPSTRFHGFRRVDGAVEGEHFSGALGDHEAYRRAVRRADSVGWSVTRADLLQVIVDVARSVVPLHAEGVVHGDIKPANVLLHADGAAAHDGLNIRTGALSAAGTKGWNAPEQIIARPVCPATDVFALAQLVVQVLEAAVFGDERSFIVPIGNGQRIRERMIALPDVYLDPSLVPLDDAGRTAWRSFLRRCLVLDTDKRVADAVTFANELATLAERHPIAGRRAVSGLAGRLVRRARGDGLAGRGRKNAGGDDAVVWMLDDSYAHVHREPWDFVVAIAA
jgi:hypothetical protein